MELIKFDNFNSSYYIEVENVAVRRMVVENDPWRSWKVMGNF